MSSPTPHVDPTPQPDGSTNVTLLEHLTTLIAAMDRGFESRLADTDLRYQQRFDAQTKALDAALAAAKDAVQAALAAAEKATTKAEGAADKRFEGVNEFRAQLSDQAATFMPRSEAEQRMSSLSEKIADMKTSLDQSAGLAAGSQVERRLQDIAELVSSQGTRMALQTGSATGLHAGWVYLLGGLGAVGTIVAIIVAITH